jgi:hypothetical protein
MIKHYSPASGAQEPSDPSFLRSRRAGRLSAGSGSGEEKR